LRSLDALHLAAALTLATSELTFATWDARLHRAAREHGLRTLPAKLA
jgi:predicted nucleic acid-binding protein